MLAPAPWGSLAVAYERLVVCMMVQPNRMCGDLLQRMLPYYQQPTLAIILGKCNITVYC